jgi:hypothetical protein
MSKCNQIKVILLTSFISLVKYGFSNSVDSTTCSVEKITNKISINQREPGLRDDSIAKNMYLLICDSTCSISIEYLDVLALVAIYERYASRELSGFLLHHVRNGRPMNYKFILSLLFFIDQFPDDTIAEIILKLPENDSQLLFKEGIFENDYIGAICKMRNGIKSPISNCPYSLGVKYILISEIIIKKKLNVKYKLK